MQRKRVKEYLKYKLSTMTKLNKSRIVNTSLFILIIGLMGCTNEFDRFTPLTSTFEIGNLSIPLEDAEKTIFNNASGIMITTFRNTIIQVPANAFTLNGADISNEEIEFYFLELYNKGDFIKYNVPTISNGQLIESDGVFYFNAFWNDNEVRLRDGESIKVLVENFNPTPGMELFYGSVDNNDEFNWEQADQNPGVNDNVQIVEFQDSSSNGLFLGYEFFADSLKWINVDIFVDVPSDKKTEVCIELGEEYNRENTSVFMVFDEYDGVVALQQVNDSNKFCEPYNASPIGAKVTFIVISKQGEDVYHFAIESTTLQQSHIMEMLPVETSIEDILTALDNL